MPSTAWSAPWTTSSPAAAGTVTGSDVWEINAHESAGLEYSRHNHNVTDLYTADPYRASDHNPEIVGLRLGAAEDTVPSRPQKPGRGSAAQHPGQGAPGQGVRERGSDRVHHVLERLFGRPSGPVATPAPGRLPHGP